MATNANTGKPIRILGIAGSLRDASFNRALLRAAVELAPSGVEITTFDARRAALLRRRRRGGR